MFFIYIKIRGFDIMSDERDLCFGQQSKTFWGFFGGLMVILVGLTQLLGDSISWLNWGTLYPYVIILVGLLLVGNTLYNRK